MAALLCLLAIGLGAQAQAPSATAASTSASAAAPSSTSASTSTSTSTRSGSAAAMPQEPPAGPRPADARLPPGHPPTTGRMGPQTGADQVRFDPALPPGTIAIRVVDVDSQPIADAPVRLSVLLRSIDEGNSKHERVGRTDPDGQLRFDKLTVGSDTTYRARTDRGPASFSSEPFTLPRRSGASLLLRSFEPLTALQDTTLIMKARVLLDIKQDTLSVTHVLDIFNFGRQAFVASDVSMPLPKDHRGFDAQESQLEGRVQTRQGNLELVGTFPPGQQRMVFQYQLPLDGSSKQRWQLPLPPRTIAATVEVGAGRDMQLTVAGFPAAQVGRSRDGTRTLVTTQQPADGGELQQLMAELGPRRLDITIDGLPASGPWRLAALLLAALLIVAGGVYLYRGRSGGELTPDEREDLGEARDALLAELSTLERMRRAGTVGPKSYARLRPQLLDALARIMTRLEPV